MGHNRRRPGCIYTLTGKNRQLKPADLTKLDSWRLQKSLLGLINLFLLRHTEVVLICYASPSWCNDVRNAVMAFRGYMKQLLNATSYPGIVADHVYAFMATILSSMIMHHTTKQKLMNMKMNMVFPVSRSESTKTHLGFGRMGDSKYTWNISNKYKMFATSCGINGTKKFRFWEQ